MTDNLSLLGPNILTQDLILGASVPRVYEARKGMVFRVRTIASPNPPTTDSLYSFAGHTFTPAGATGRFGPTLTQCRSAYSSATWAQNNNFFTMTTQGYQVWTVPQTASYRIEARGANGGSSFGGPGGGGARMIGVFSLTRGQKLRIVVGQPGTNNTGLNGGGGGASYVMQETGSTTADIFVIAGGGGAGGYQNNATNRGATTADPSQPGWNGSSNISLNNGRTGGTGGLMFDTTGSGAGGGGLLGDGQTSINSAQQAAGKGGQSFVNGGVGGFAFNGSSMDGGFGGGGSGDWYWWYGSGGGGGYSGGSGGYYFGSGGGGSSFNNGTDQVNTANQNFAQGQVIIQVNDPPIVTTGAVTAITGTSATGNGNVTNNKGIVISTRGIVWDTNTNPTIILTTKSEETGSFGNGAFSRLITGLYGGTVYYVRAYAINIGDVVGYGDTVTFTTNNSAPAVTTNSGTSVSGGSSVISATILATGGFNVTTRGVCWNTSPNPTIANSRTIENGSFGAGSFTATTNGMLNNIVYFVRAYATNSIGTSYGSEITVTSSIPTNTLTGWTTAGFVSTDNTSIIVQSQGRTKAEIQTFFGVTFSDTQITNGAAVRYNTQITLSSASTMRFNWILSGGDMGSGFRDRAFLVISGHSVSSNNGSFFIADSLTNPLNGTFARSISAGTFTFGFACFNWSDTAVDAFFTFNTITFS
jgi:hypothetical protein